MTARERARRIVEILREATELRKRPKTAGAADELLMMAERLRLDGFPGIMLATEPKPVEPPREMKIATEFPERRPGVPTMAEIANSLKEGTFSANPSVLTPAEVDSLEKDGD